jgi:hypothetical protein
MSNVCDSTNSVQISYPFGLVVTEFFCPACGAQILGQEEDPKPCCHVIYTYLDLIGDSMYVHEGLEGQLQGEEDFLEEVRRVLLPSETALHVSLATGGMACGPVWSSITVGLDLQGASVSIPPAS